MATHPASPTRLAILGGLALMASVALAVVAGLVLMGYEDQGGDWADAAALATWRGALPPAWRALFWGAMLGAPVAAGIGVLCLGCALWRRFARSRVTPAADV